MKEDPNPLFSNRPDDAIIGRDVLGKIGMMIDFVNNCIMMLNKIKI